MPVITNCRAITFYFLTRVDFRKDNCLYKVNDSSEHPVIKVSHVFSVSQEREPYQWKNLELTI